MIIFVIWGLFAGAEPGVTVTQLDGKTVLGRSLAVFGAEVTVTTSAGTAAAVPLTDVLKIEFAGDEPPTVKGTSFALAVDGSLWRCRGATLQGRSATLELFVGSPVVLQAAQLSALAFDVGDDGLATWQRAARQPRTADSLIVTKGAGRIELEGAVARIGPDEVGFVVDGQEIAVRRERVAAVFFRNRPTETETQATVVDRAGNRWSATRIRWSQAGVAVDAPTGVQRQIALDELRRVDFSPGKLAYLSDLEPTVAAHTPFFDVPWPYRKDSSFANRPLSVAGVVFSRGLCLHSKTVLEYDLSGQFRRFDATLGIDDSAGPFGDAPVRIFGDERLLWSAEVRAGQPALDVTLDVTGASRLRLEVDFGKLLDLGDHVVFGNARLVK